MGALLVGLQVVLEELVGQVAADGFVRRLAPPLVPRLSASQAMFSSACQPPHGARRNSRTVGGVILEPKFLGDRHDAVGVGWEGLIAGRVGRRCRRGRRSSRARQAVTAHHAADGVGDQFLHRVLTEAGPLLIFGARIAAVAVGGFTVSVICSMGTSG